MSNENEISGARIKAIVERVERLEEQKKGLSEDIKGVYDEAKGNGLDAKIIRKIVSLRKISRQARQEA
jgi:uncharacterized protein (UPF0335 family)